MEQAIQIVIVAGARPNFMKVAPIIHAVQRHNARAGSPLRFDFRLVHTGQHYDAAMSAVFFRELGIPQPQVNLGVGSGSHAVQTAQVMIGFERVCLEQRPDWVIVVGDVNSTLACTLVAAKLGIRVAHVEAGLRSYDRTMPEELNRVATDALSDLLLTPSDDANENLRREGIPEERIRFVGNVMIDALLANLDQARQSRILEACEVRSGEFAYVTLHRPANVDNPGNLRAIASELRELSVTMPVVFPIHPRTRKMLRDFKVHLNTAGLRLLDPLGYHDSLCLTENARFVLTDSGGLQEEATFFRTPCLTLRPNTERPITITEGSNRLSSIESLRADIQDVLSGPARRGTVPRLWDGRAAERVVAAILEIWGGRQFPAASGSEAPRPQEGARAQRPADSTNHTKNGSEGSGAALRTNHPASHIAGALRWQE